jgi:hypothetical protein
MWIDEEAIIVSRWTELGAMHMGKNIYGQKIPLTP